MHMLSELTELLLAMQRVYPWTSLPDLLARLPGEEEDDRS